MNLAHIEFIKENKFLHFYSSAVFLHTRLFVYLGRKNRYKPKVSLNFCVFNVFYFLVLSASFMTAASQADKQRVCIFFDFFNIIDKKKTKNIPLSLISSF